MGKISVGRYAAIVQKLMDAKDSDPVPNFEPALFPMLALEVDRPEWKFLAGERLCWGSIFVAAVAAQLSGVRLRNPRASGVLAVVERVLVTADATTPVHAGVELVSGVEDGSTAGTEGIRDTRSAAGSPTCVLSGQAPLPGVGTVFVRARAPTDATLQLEVPLVIHPDNRFWVEFTTVNLAALVTIFWRERHLEASETR